MTPSVLLGLAVGDALGQPFEFSTSDQIIKSGWKGNMKEGSRGFQGMWNLKPGQYTDDTKMALCLSNSLIEKGEFDLDDVSKKYIEWVESRDVRGIGIRTEAAIHNMMRGISPLESGKKNAGRPKPSFKRISKAPEDIPSDSLHGPGDFCGCGTVMRCAPIGIFFHSDRDKRTEAAKLDATMTHDHADARDSSVMMCNMVADMFHDDEPFHSAWNQILNQDFEYDHIPRLCKEAAELAKDDSTSFADAIKLGTSGTAHETLASALYCFLRYTNFKDAVASAVLIGGDTDSRAAIVGALAGAKYGIQGIPKEWVEQVEDSEKLQEIDSKLWVPDE